MVVLVSRGVAMSLSQSFGDGLASLHINVLSHGGEFWVKAHFVFDVVSLFSGFSFHSSPPSR